MKILDKIAGIIFPAMGAAAGLFVGYFLLRGLIAAFGLGAVIFLLICLR